MRTTSGEHPSTSPATTGAPRRIRASAYAPASARLAWAASLALHAAGLAICAIAPTPSPPPPRKDPPEPLSVQAVALRGFRQPPRREHLADEPRPAKPTFRPRTPPPAEPDVPDPPCEWVIEAPPLPRPPPEPPPLIEIPSPLSRVPLARREPAPEPPSPKEDRRTPEEPAPSSAPSSPSAGRDQATVRVPPTPAQNPAPAYPHLARRRGYQGRVVLLARVGTDGQCLSLRIKTSSGHAVLDEAARRAVERWRFRPATVDGTPVEGEVEVPIRFVLTEAGP